MQIGEALAQLVKIVVLPPGSLLLLLGVGLLVVRRFARLGRALCAGAFCLLYFLASGVGSWLLVHPLEQLEQPLAPGTIVDARAVVVLAAGRIRSSPEYGGTAVPDFLAFERMAYGAYLVRARGLPLLVSGGYPSSQRDESLAAGMRRAYRDVFGLQVRWLEERSNNTAENASLSAAILNQAGIGHVLLVTDALHMRRARRAFERAGIRVTAAPTFYHEAGAFDPLRLLPTVENLRRSHYALYEWLGLGWYYLKAE